jgi:hypothetical protein
VLTAWGESPGAPARGRTRRDVSLRNVSYHFVAGAVFHAPMAGERR